MAILSDRGAPRKALGPQKPSSGAVRQAATANGILTGSNASSPLGRSLGSKPSSQVAPSGGGSRSLGGFTGGGGGGSLGGDFGGGGGGSLGGGMMPALAPTEGEYQAQDAILAAALGALDRAMSDYNAQYDADLQTYDRDYNKGLGNLGFRDLDPGDAVNMGWDWNDVLTSSGAAYQNQLNDFANRGALQSSGYADALAALTRSLNDQKGAMDTGRSDFLSDKARGKNEFVNQDTLARQQARAESTARRGAQYGIV